MNLASYIIPYRQSDCVHRRENLLAVCRWLATMDDIETIIVEQDVQPTLDRAAVGAQVKIIFVHNPGPFNKSWAFNIGARQASADILAFGDGDVIASDGFLDSVNLCKQGWHGAKPYRNIVDLTQEETARVRSGEWNFVPPRAAEIKPDTRGAGEFIVFGGGLFLLTRRAFWKIGGFDERFIGWGGEDNAMTIKLARFNARLTGIVSHYAVHLWHPRVNATTFGQPFYAANKDLVAEYAMYTDAELADLCARQREAIGILPLVDQRAS